MLITVLVVESTLYKLSMRILLILLMSSVDQLEAEVTTEFSWGIFLCDPVLKIYGR